MGSRGRPGVSRAAPEARNRPGGHGRDAAARGSRTVLPTRRRRPSSSCARNAWSSGWVRAVAGRTGARQAMSAGRSTWAGVCMLDPMIRACGGQRRRTSDATACPPRAPAATRLPPRAAGRAPRPRGLPPRRRVRRRLRREPPSASARRRSARGRGPRGRPPGAPLRAWSRCRPRAPVRRGPGRAARGPGPRPRGTGHHDGVARAAPAALGSCPAPCRTRWAGRRAGRRRAASPRRRGRGGPER